MQEGISMTIKEFYQWAKGNNIEDYDINPLDIRGLNINNEEKEVIL